MLELKMSRSVFKVQVPCMARHTVSTFPLKALGGVVEESTATFPRDTKEVASIREELGSPVWRVAGVAYGGHYPWIGAVCIYLV